MRRIGLVAVAAGFLVGADGPKRGGGTADARALQGTWTMASIVWDGEAVSEDVVRTGRLVVEGDRYTMTLGGAPARSTFTLDPSTSPRSIDFTLAEGPQKGETLPGIYELDGDTYRLCRPFRPGGARPSGLASARGSGLILVVWKRGSAGAGRDESEAKELERIKGAWVQDGEGVPAENKKARLAYTGRDFVGRDGDRVLFRGNVRLDPTRTPKAIDLTLTTGPTSGKVVLGVYELDGETYRGCLAPPGKDRPTALTGDPGLGQKSFAFRRVPPAEEKKLLAREELERFQGTWQLVSVESNGEKAPEERTRPVRVTITGETHTVRFGDRVVAHRVSFELDPTKTPREVTDTLNDGANQGKQIRGIYRIEGDTLTSCVAPPDKERPTEFAARTGSGHTLRVFRRVPPEETRRAAVAAERERLSGRWKSTSYTLDGKTTPPEQLADVVLVVSADGTAVASSKGKTIVTAATSIDPTADPRTVDLTFTEGPQRGQTSLGIYELDGDTYRLCRAAPGQPRPARFASKPGSGLALMTYVREKL